MRSYPRVTENTVCQWLECGGCQSPLDPTDLTAVERWTQARRGDVGSMIELRQVLHRFDDERLLAQHSDEQVCERLAMLLRQGRLKICGVRPKRRYVPPQKVEVEGPPPAKPVRRWVEPPPPAPVVQEDPTFPASADILAIAKVLKEAAESGHPFCEECEKAKLARATPMAPARSGAGTGGRTATASSAVAAGSQTDAATLPDPAPVAATPPPALSLPASDQPSFGPNVDAAAMAEALQAAARSGKPFCEECEKAKLAQASAATTVS